METISYVFEGRENWIGIICLAAGAYLDARGIEDASGELYDLYCASANLDAMLANPNAPAYVSVRVNS